MPALSSKSFLKGILMVAAMLFTAFTLSRYAVLLQGYISIQYSFYFELAMVAGQLLFQSLFLLKRTWPVIYRYWPELLGISLAGSLLLWLFMVTASLHSTSGPVALLYFFCVVAVMFFLHRARLRKLSLPAYLSYTWLLYRALILLYIL